MNMETIAIPAGVASLVMAIMGFLVRGTFDDIKKTIAKHSEIIIALQTQGAVMLGQVSELLKQVNEIRSEWRADLRAQSDTDVLVRTLRAELETVRSQVQRHEDAIQDLRGAKT